MFIFKIGESYLNLCYLIRAEPLPADHPRMRITVESGLTFDVEGEDVERLAGQLDALAADPIPRQTTTIIRRQSSPSSGIAKEGA